MHHRALNLPAGQLVALAERRQIDAASQRDSRADQTPPEFFAQRRGRNLQLGAPQHLPLDHRIEPLGCGAREDHQPFELTE